MSSLAKAALEALVDLADRDRVRQMNIIKLCIGVVMMKMEINHIEITAEDIAASYTDYSLTTHIEDGVMFYNLAKRET